MSKKQFVVLIMAAMFSGIIAAVSGFAVFSVLLNKNEVPQPVLQAHVVETFQAVPMSAKPTEAVPVVTPEPTPEPTSEPTPYVSPVNFDKLHNLNEDIYAWISITGMSIDYPLLQHPTEDNYYLDYTVDRVYGYPGSLYTQTKSAKDFSDYLTVIYGHNMKNGDMFGNLKDYRSEDFLNSHREILIYTPEKTLTYKVFAAVVYTDELIPSAFNFSNAADRQKFIDTLDRVNDPASQILDDMTVTSEDHLLTLSTCISGEPEHRYIIVAALQD